MQHNGLYREVEPYAKYKQRQKREVSLVKLIHVPNITAITVSRY